jgi:hypothetical protein
MEKAYFLQRITDEAFEEVDEFVFTNFKYAVQNNQERYNGNRLIVENGKTTLSLQEVNVKTMTAVARLAGVQDVGRVTNFVAPVETVELHLPRQSILHNVKTGDQWVKRPRPKTVAETKLAA